jgi:eukaryotic-like serine/threonine-protein kinase
VRSSLNHPNIATIYELQEANGSRFLVLELVEGETLAERIKRGPIPIDEALNVAKSICDALEAAHEKGVVHRDLKPANVKVTPEGNVKVLDFGLAKVREAAATAASLSNSPTLLSGSLPGVIMGTAAYMSPEQAKGFETDQRGDIFSFGSILYEMLARRPAFTGDTVSDVLASVLKSEPDWTLLPANLNPRVRELLNRALQKNPKRRWYAIGDVRMEIETALTTPPVQVVGEQQRVGPKPLWKRAIPLLLCIFLGAAIALVGTWNFRPPTPPTIFRFRVALEEGQQFTDAGGAFLTVSPDGTQMVYVANDRLYLSSLSELQPKAIAGTESTPALISGPVFSPDGQSVIFWSDGLLKRISINGGTPVTICPAAIPQGMSWDTNGILFNQPQGIMRVSANGGKPEIVIASRNGEILRKPRMLPDGQTILFTIAPLNAESQIAVQSLASGQRKNLIRQGGDAWYIPTGHLVYMIDSTLMAIGFDLRKLELYGAAAPVVEGIRMNSRGVINVSSAGQFALSTTGVLIYIPGPSVAGVFNQSLGLSDRTGTVKPLGLQPGSYRFPRISPDGKEVAFQSDDGKEAIVWIYEISGSSAPRRLTFGGSNRYPIWSADSQRIAYQSDRQGDNGIFWQRADGTGTAERLTKPESGSAHIPEGWSSNGDTFLFDVEDENHRHSLWTFSTEDKTSAPFDNNVQSSLPISSVFSPDGRWIAYEAGELGDAHIYVQPFPNADAKYQVSKGLGHHPVWSRDGKEIFYTPGANQFAVIGIATSPSLKFTNAIAIPATGGLQGASLTRNFDVMSDGKTFIAFRPPAQSATGPPQINVVLNWFEELKQRVSVP